MFLNRELEQILAIFFSASSALSAVKGFDPMSVPIPWVGYCRLLSVSDVSTG